MGYVSKMCCKPFFELCLGECLDTGADVVANRSSSRGPGARGEPCILAPGSHSHNKGSRYIYGTHMGPKVVAWQPPLRPQHIAYLFSLFWGTVSTKDAAHWRAPN